MKKGSGGGLRERRIILGVTGCIAAYKACELASGLAQAGARVRTIMTAEAGEFIRPLSFRALTGEPVFTGLFDAPREFDPVHVSLADWAELVAIVPATANIIGKIAAGLADDLLSCVAMASRAPLLIAPAMNTRMWESPAVRENVKTLARRGARFVGPCEGRLACGEEGVGRLAPVDEIARAVAEMLAR